MRARLALLQLDNRGKPTADYQSKVGKYLSRDAVIIMEEGSPNRP